MSRQIALDCIACRPTPRPAHTELSLEYHPALVEAAARAADQPPEPPDAPPDAARRALYNAWDIDILWRTHDGCVDWSQAGRTTDLGHAAYAADGATLALTRGLPGFIFAVGNHIPANVTDERCRRFINYLRRSWTPWEHPKA